MRQFFIPNIIDNLNEFYQCGEECQDYCQPKKLFISEDKEKIYIDAPVPGINSEDVDVTFNPKTKCLTICGKNAMKRENVEYHQVGQTTYYYEIPLSQEIDPDASMQAVTKNGMLSVVLSKHKESQPLKIDVRTV